MILKSEYQGELYMKQVQSFSKRPVSLVFDIVSHVSSTDGFVAALSIWCDTFHVWMGVKD